LSAVTVVTVFSNFDPSALLAAVSPRS